MISEEEVERAVHFLRDHAEKAAIAKANRISLEESRKSLKAVIMREHPDLPIAKAEAEAYADERYRVHLEGLKQAVYEEEKLRLLLRAAEAKIHAFQTLSANLRGKL